MLEKDSNWRDSTKKPIQFHNFENPDEIVTIDEIRKKLPNFNTLT